MNINMRQRGRGEGESKVADVEAMSPREGTAEGGVMRSTVAKAVGLSLLVALVALGESFKLYPGAKRYTPPDTEETRAAAKAMPPGMQSTIYLTDDAYEKVSGFYKGIGKEYTMPGMPKGAKLPNGQEMKQAFYIFDGAADLGSSKNWAKIQRPYIGSVDVSSGVPEYKDIRDVTAIVAVEKK